MERNTMKGAVQDRGGRNEEGWVGGGFQYCTSRTVARTACLQILPDSDSVHWQGHSLI